MTKIPTRFNDLSRNELIRTADEDFAFDLSEDEKKSKATLLAAFTEAELKFSDYLLANPQEEPEEVEETEFVIVSNPQEEKAEKVKEEDKMLVRMDRENPLFEFRRYRFTRQHPYALMERNDAEAIMRSEEGFRQAFPSELDEYYS